MEKTKYCPDCGSKEFSWETTQVEVGQVVEDTHSRHPSVEYADYIVGLAQDGVTCTDCGQSQGIADLADSDHTEDRGGS